MEVGCQRNKKEHNIIVQWVSSKEPTHWIYTLHIPGKWRTVTITNFDLVPVIEVCLWSKKKNCKEISRYNIIFQGFVWMHILVTNRNKREEQELSTTRLNPMTYKEP